MRSMIQSVIFLITSILLLSVAVFAWFTNTNRAHVQPLSVSVTDGSPLPYEIKYYTKDNIYKFDIPSNSVLVYDASSSSFVAQESLPIDNPSFTFNGAFMNDYDPIIEENNLEKNVIVEITIDFEGNGASIRNSLYSDKLISNFAVANYPYTTSRPYYVTEAALVQSLISKDYNNFLEGENKYDTLNNVFNQMDGNGDPIHPIYSFYQDDVYTGSVNFGNVTITSDITQYKLYYNFSYDEARIDSFLVNENIDVVIDNMSFIVFFQDVKFSIVVGGNS
ncbi:MAG: hypothetical protein CVV61_04700 [Tenericutes bacterium HGW-Tenericutes-6]|nr:MAG: hypothetical protein CVV61_04700 [Tenericutes bacterium HGW-Tenericutes-6]